LVQVRGEGGDVEAALKAAKKPAGDSRVWVSDQLKEESEWFSVCLGWIEISGKRRLEVRGAGEGGMAGWGGEG
jgi:poly(3-hydroxyalkanoate) synthetase